MDKYLALHHNLELLENWVTDEDAVELFSDIPITNTAVVDTWQWVVSEPRALEASSVMYAVYSECFLEEDVNLRMVYDDYVDFAKFAQENGDTVGRKLIVQQRKLIQMLISID